MGDGAISQKGNSTMKKTLTVTIGIPTCYGAASLLRAVESIRGSRGVGDFQVLVVADSKPIPSGIKAEFSRMNVKLTENVVPGTQMKKVKQMIAKVRDDIFVVTHDDVRFDPDALASIIHYFEKDRRITMVGANIMAEKAQSQFERIVDVGLRGTATIGQAWRKGDNYLLSNGRCLAFRTEHLRKMILPDHIVNADAYFYFENKRRGGKFAWAREARVFIKNPKYIAEHLRQSRRFLFSQEELSRYFDKTIAEEYAVPRYIQLEGLKKELSADPLHCLLYLGILVYAKLTQGRDSDYRSPLWKVNVSTKG